MSLQWRGCEGIIHKCSHRCCTEPGKTTLSVRNWAGSGSPTWLHSQRLFQCLAPACSGFKKLQHKFISLLLIAIRTIRKGFPSRREITDRKETSLQTWFHLHHVLCPRVSAVLQMISWRGRMLMETLNNICSSGRSIVVAKQEILVILEKFPYLPSLPRDNCLSHRPGVTDWHRISKQHSLSECSSTLGPWFVAETCCTRYLSWNTLLNQCFNSQLWCKMWDSSLCCGTTNSWSP